jgi:putative ABC transport system permease protein
MKSFAMPPLLLRSGLRHQLRHRWQAFLALSGIIMGVAVVLAVDLANTAVKASFQLSAEQLQGKATHRLISQGGQIPQSLYQKLFTTPQHPPMAPVISSRIRIKDNPHSYQLLGLDLFAENTFRPQLPTAVHGTGILAEWLSDPGAVIISQSTADALGLKLHSEFTLLNQTHPFPLRVFEIITNPEMGSQDLLIVDIATAQAISGQIDSLSHIDLILDENQLEWIQQHIPNSVTLIDIKQQTSAVVRLSEAFELNLTAMSLLALLVGLFLIFNAMSFSIVQRRNLFGRLRALGIVRKELYRLVIAEALILGIIGTLIGLLLGSWLGKGLTGIVAETVSALYYQVSADAMQLSSWSISKAIILGIGGTLIATWIPARMAANTKPLTTLSRSELEQTSKQQLPLLGLIGGLLVVTGLLVAFQVPGGVLPGFVGLFITLIGCSLITPLGLLWAQWLLAGLPLGGVWRMATRDMDRHLSRLATAAAALMVALSATVGVSIMVGSMRSSVSDWLLDLLNADSYIAAQGFEQGAVIDPAAITKVQQISQLSGISLYRNSKITLHDRKVKLLGAQLTPESRQGYQILDGNKQTIWKQFDEGAILISEPLAYRLQLRPGDTLSLPTLQGQTALPIAATLRDYSSEHGRIYINLNSYRQYWNDQQINTMAVFSSTLDSASLNDLLHTQLSQWDNLMFTQAREIYSESMAVFGKTFRITEVLRLLSMLVAFIGILTALMAVQLERRKEFAVLRALGLTRLQVSQLIILESLLLGLVAAAMAIPTGLAMAWVLTDAIQLRAFGWTMPFQISSNPLWMSLLLGLTAALLASLYPAWRAAQGNPAGQLRED